MTPDASLPPADVAAESCYCVCHSSFSSRAWCEHCQGDNAVGRVPRCTVPDQSNAFGTCARALPCAVHPAADEQRPTPPLTEEELAWMESRVAMATGTFLTSLPWSAEHTEDSDPGYHSGEVHGGHEGEYTILRHELPPVADFVAAAPSDVRRLIADLRSARAEVERLGRLCGDYATEVGRLRAQNAEYVDFIATVVRVPNAP